MRKYLLTSFILFIPFCFVASQPLASPSSIIKYRLHKLNTLGTVLYIAAHPDDENTRLLSYFANEQKFATVYLSLTRGDGGQNLIGTEQGDLLGLIRTHELMAARSIDGAKQCFTRAIDFGYSKTAEESFSFWNYDSVLSDMVNIIRKVQPDIIITRFPANGDGGHGHHTASAILAADAFEKSGDPKYLSNPSTHSPVWQSKRLFWNVFRAKKEEMEGRDDVAVINIGSYNFLLGTSYGEMASESRSMHKSQGFGVSRQRGYQADYLQLIKGDMFKEDPFSGISVHWDRLQNGTSISSLIEKAIQDFDEENPSALLPQLLDIRKNIAALIKDEHWKTIKLQEVEELILQCGGFFIEALSSEFEITVKDSISLQSSFIHRCHEKVVLQAIESELIDSIFPLNKEIIPNQLYNTPFSGQVNSAVQYSNPYWLRNEHGPSLFNITNNTNTGLPINNDNPTIRFIFTINAEEFILEREIKYKWVDPVKGEQYRLLEIVPAVDIQYNPENLFFNSDQTETLHVTIQSKKDSLQGDVFLKTDGKYNIAPAKHTFLLNSKNENASFEFAIQRTSQSENCSVEIITTIDTNEYALTSKHIIYDHIPIQIIQKPANISFISMDGKFPALTIGYIPGAGDRIPEVLNQLGYSVDIINSERIALEDIRKYDVIITGIRAYNSNDKIANYQPILKEYVHRGGRLLVQYNTMNFLSSLKTDIGPYPFTISRKRVTEENAEVKITDPGNVLLTYPNLITSKDFEYWVQERGLYFADNFSNYHSLFSMNDHGEESSDGSLIYTNYGKGMFIYTGLSFFRQLPIGHPGAIRLFINLISNKK